MLNSAEKKLAAKQQEFFRFQQSLFLLPEIANDLHSHTKSLGRLRELFVELEQPLEALYAESKKKDLDRHKRASYRKAAKEMRKSIKGLDKPVEASDKVPAAVSLPAMDSSPDARHDEVSLPHTENSQAPLEMSPTMK